VVGKDLPRSTPVDQQVDPAAVLAFVEAVDDPTVELHSLMVLRHGHVVAEGWWAPHAPARTRLLYSLSKSFTSTALGFALSEELFALDDTVVSHFPEFDEQITDPRSRSVRLRHVASMASGHNRDMLEEAVTRDPWEPVRGFLLVPPDEEPGTVFAYSQPCTYMSRPRCTCQRMNDNAARRNGRCRGARPSARSRFARAARDAPPDRRVRRRPAPQPGRARLGVRSSPARERLLSHDQMIRAPGSVGPARLRTLGRASRRSLARRPRRRWPRPGQGDSSANQQSP
jgi:Beta-lactamase